MDLAQSMIQNIAIIAMLVLLFNFIPGRIRLRSRLTFSVGVGVVFGLAAVISIPDFWGTTGGQIIGFNIILAPLAGFIGGPVSAIIVAIAILGGSTVSDTGFNVSGIISVTSGVLLGILFFYARSWSRFPKSYTVQLILLSAGVSGIVLLGAFVSGGNPDSGGPQPGALPLPSMQIFAILPFALVVFAGTFFLGSLTGFIDRKKQAERELREYRDHLEVLVEERTTELRSVNSLQKATIESTADGIVVTDRDGIIRTYNRKAAHILNLPARMPRDLQKTWIYIDHIVASLSDPDTFVRIVATLPDSAEQVVTTDLEFTSGRIYELYVQPQRIDDQIIGRVWSLRDITDRRLAEAAIQSANDKLNLLSNITRHDIFNQLTALTAYLELVEMDNHDPSASGHMEAMKKSLEVIRLQLEFTRDYQDLGLRAPGWQQAETVFRKAAESFEGKNLTFTCTTATVGIFADPMIGQVFYNLIDNSLRHGENVSEIRLSARPEDPDLILLYEDNGTGVVPEEKEKIFIKGFGKHTGLGMFLIKEILSITGFTIRETGVYGKGARFEIRVPAGKFRLTS
jgi:signal transduction histidine kinase